ILPQIIADLLQDLPDVSIELVPSNAVENLLQRDADIAIRMVRPTQNDLIMRRVNTMQIGIYAHRDYLQKAPAIERFEDLSNHVIIGYDRNDLVIRGFEKAGFKVTPEFFRFRCDDQVTTVEALASGIGIGFAPHIVAGKNPDIVPVLQEFKIEDLPMWLTSHRELRTSAKIRAVNDYLGERLQNLKL
ncbi:MAG: LysR substrate-binding domain-containing protein, partial [Salaquimonas sp.]